MMLDINPNEFGALLLALELGAARREAQAAERWGSAAAKRNHDVATAMRSLHRRLMMENAVAAAAARRQVLEGRRRIAP